MRADEREYQIQAARKQVLFREVNERVSTLQQQWGTPPQIDFVCECADDRCSIAIQVAMDEYERVRSNPLHFVVAPDHFYAGAEILVEKAPRHWVVEVIEAGRPVAEATNPRRRRE